jgi:ABC-type Mn2+/Zn2+ transport system permease subunit
MSETLALFQERIVQDALKAALLVGALCSFLGVFVVLKRIVFVGAALAEAASLGAALAFSAPAIWLFDALTVAAPVLEPLRHFKPLVLALALMLLAVAFFSRPHLTRRITREAVIGVTFAGAIGLTILVLSSVPGHEQHELDVLRGNILGVEAQELAEIAVVAGLVALVQALFHKEFVLVSFDPEVAQTLGYRSPRWELLWYLSLGVMIAVSIHVAGTVLVFAYLVIPPVTALLLSRRLAAVFLLSVLSAVVATVAGVLLSVSPANLPTSPSIVGCSTALFAAAWIGKTLLGLRSLK